MQSNMATLPSNLEVVVAIEVPSIRECEFRTAAVCDARLLDQAVILVRSLN